MSTSSVGPQIYELVAATVTERKKYDFIISVVIFNNNKHSSFNITDIV